VKLLPETATAAIWTRLLPASVTQGVTEVTFTPLKLKAWLVVELLPLMATMTTVAGEEVESLLKAATETPAEGEAVAPMR
jgi:hypothetical protein